MTAIEVGFIWIILGALIAGAFRFFATRLILGTGISRINWLLRPPLALIVGLVLAASAYWLFLDQASDLAIAKTDGHEAILLGRVVAVAHAPDDTYASVYSVEDPSGRIEVATTDHPPQVGALTIVKGTIRMIGNRNIIMADRRFSTF